jgi:hypothetical protein
VLLKEKPNKIQLGTMNLHNFDKAIGEFYEFNHSLNISIEQLYLNRNKLDATVNKLLDFCLHIDTEQYGFDFPAGADVTAENIRKERSKDPNLEAQFEDESMKDHEQNPRINVTEYQDVSYMRNNSNKAGVKNSISNVSSSAKIKTSKDLIKKISVRDAKNKSLAPLNDSFRYCLF